MGYPLVGATLSAENQQMLWVPPGFAHGFYVLSESADFLYKTTEFYVPEAERCVLNARKIRVIQRAPERTGDARGPGRGADLVAHDP